MMQRRPLSKEHGGLWEFPGGKVEPGETPRTALVREIAEELGIRIQAKDLRAFAFGDSDDREDGGTIVVMLYSCDQWEGEPRSLEGGQIAWVPASRFRDLDMPPIDAELSRRLIQCEAA
ncbi:NUDIX domain-containing protein [Altererythrobacter aurantiacus]|uniref:8-oxo-dGTP diphosphatase n=2 Tax=Parapontixanthobacter aurantiacus TaxID=1463599 RepID=A0A844ZDK9_9SPHN|nr:NUDIX domain-containing protein [Parapontixanthobacter aurantiacus]